MAGWYYDDFGEETGPVSPAVMKQRVADGTITEGTRVRREGGEWVAAEHIPGLLGPRPAAPPSRPANVVDKLIPSKNGPALAAYYLGIFSLMPCLGIPLTVPAVVCGVIGLRKFKRNPAVKGAAHAWTGVVLGSLMFLIQIAGIVGANYVINDV